MLLHLENKEGWAIYFAVLPENGDSRPGDFDGVLSPAFSPSSLFNTTPNPAMHTHKLSAIAILSSENINKNTFSLDT